MAATLYDEKYVPSDAVNQAQQALQKQQAAKPGEYQSPWQGQLNDVLGQIQNRDEFQYDINEDALYLQAAQRYIQQGKQAMMDTLGQAAAMTGGYGNSYAQTAGQQTYQNYLLGLTDMIPQFQQMALDKYQMEGDDLLNRYSLLAQQEESAYGRYNDMLSRYYAELDRLQGVYDVERDYDYGMYRDMVADAQWQREFEENQRRYDQEWAAKQKKEKAKSSGRSGGQNSVNTNDNSSATVDIKSVLDLGYGPISGDTLSGLVASGKVNATQQGNKIVFSNNPATSTVGNGARGALVPSGYSTLSGTSKYLKQYK